VSIEVSGFEIIYWKYTEFLRDFNAILEVTILAYLCVHNFRGMLIVAYMCVMCSLFQKRHRMFIE
jgi:hypothetical protein